MKKLLILLIIPFLSFGQCVEEMVEMGYACDCVSISLVQYNEAEGYVEIEVITDSFPFTYPYAGFALGGQELAFPEYFTMTNMFAAETLETSGNVYGLSGNMVETRILQVTNEFSLPYNQAMHLVNYLFAGTPEWACSFDFYIPENLLISETSKIRKVVKVIDVLGRSYTNKGFQLHIYDDGSVEKKYLIK